MNLFDPCRISLNNYLNTRDVVNNGKVVSAYSLYKMAERKFIPLLYGAYHNSKLEKKVGEILSERLFVTSGNIPAAQYASIFSNVHCKATPFLEKDRAGIVFDYNCGGIFGERLIIYKDLNTQRFSSKYHFRETEYDAATTQKILSKCSNTLNSIFKVMCEYQQFFNKHDSLGNGSTTFSNSPITGKISYNHKGEVSYSVSFADSCFGPGTNLLYDSKGQEYEALLSKNAKYILRKTPIIIDSLPVLFQTICQEKQLKQKVYHR